MAKPTILFIENLEPTLPPDVRSMAPDGFNLTLADAWDEPTHVKLAVDADYIVCGGVPVSGRVIDAAARLKLVQKLGIGVDKIDLLAAARRQIPVAITAGANSLAVAEASFMLMMAVSRRLLEADASLRAGTWIRPALGAESYELADKTLGIIGLGNIGKQVARRAAAFDMHTLYFDKVRPPAEVERRLNVEFAPLEALLAASDFVTIHVPFTHETHHLINAAALALMKPSAVIVNTARGEVIDEAALEAALRAGHLRGAGLDVLANEPVRAKRSLFGLPNVVLCPHIAGMTRDTRRRLWRHAFANCRRVENGESLDDADLIDPYANTTAPIGAAAGG